MSATITAATTEAVITLDLTQGNVTAGISEANVSVVDDGAANITAAATTSTITTDTAITSTIASATTVEVIAAAEQGPQGIPGSTGDVQADAALVGLTWGTPGAESANTIEITGTITEFTAGASTSSLVDVLVIVSDGATDCEPSETATLAAASTPVGTVLSGSGTATMQIRSASGLLKVKVTETAAANRYLWVRGGGNARLWVRSLAGVQELVFA